MLIEKKSCLLREKVICKKVQEKNIQYMCKKKSLMYFFLPTSIFFLHICLYFLALCTSFMPTMCICAKKKKKYATAYMRNKYKCIEIANGSRIKLLEKPGKKSKTRTALQVKMTTSEVVWSLCSVHCVCIKA